MTNTLRRNIHHKAGALLVALTLLQTGGCALQADGEGLPPESEAFETDPELIGETSSAVMGANGQLTHANWGEPACAHGATGPYVAAYVRIGKIFYRKYSGGAWGNEIDTWFPAGVTSFKRVAATKTTSAITALFAFGNDGKLYWKTFTSNAQGGWSTKPNWPLPDTTRGLAAAAAENGNIHAIYYLPGAGPTRHLAHVFHDGTNWQVETGDTVPALRVNGAGLLAATAWATNRLDVVATLGSKLAHLANSGGGGGWVQKQWPYVNQDNNFPGFALSGIGLTSTGSGKLDLFVGNLTHHKLMYTYFRDNAWSTLPVGGAPSLAFDQVGNVSPGTYVGSACDANSGKRVDVFGALTGGDAWQAFWTNFNHI